MPVQGVLIVGEHALLRAFTCAWLNELKGLRVLAESGDAARTIALVGKWKPSLVLMDLETLQSVNLDLIAKLRIVHPKVKVIVYFALANDHLAIKAIQAGAAGFVVKSAESVEMENAIRTVLGGGVYLSPKFLRFVGNLDGLTDARGKALGPRQSEILKLIALGLSTKAIAFELKLSGKTVDGCKQRLARSLGLKGPAELFKYAIGMGLASA